MHKVSKGPFFSELDDFFDNQDRPVTPEYIYRMSMDETFTPYSDRQSGKIREYVKTSIEDKLAHRFAGGVIYPKPVKEIVKDDCGCLDQLFTELVLTCYKEGFTVGNRRILTDVHVSGLDLRLGGYHYTDLGYTSSNLTRAWNTYFNDHDIIDFSYEIDWRPGFSTIYNCADPERTIAAEDYNQCLDSVSCIVGPSMTPIIHANYRISNLNRMTLVDFFMLHRFCRIAFELKRLETVTMSLHFNSLTLDIDALGWLRNIKELRDITKKHRVSPDKYNFKRLKLPAEFYKNPKINDVGTNLFIRNTYGLENLSGTATDFQITHNTR